jgi:hypothetical protein
MPSNKKVMIFLHLPSLWWWVTFNDYNTETATITDVVTTTVLHLSFLRAPAVHVDARCTPLPFSPCCGCLHCSMCSSSSSAVIVTIFDYSCWALLDEKNDRPQTEESAECEESLFSPSFVSPLSAPVSFPCRGCCW